MLSGLIPLERNYYLLKKKLDKMFLSQKVNGST